MTRERKLAFLPYQIGFDLGSSEYTHEFNFFHNSRQLHSLRDEMYKSKTTLEKEVSSLREANQMITLKLNTAENKISSLEAEVFSVNLE